MPDREQDGSHAPIERVDQAVVHARVRRAVPGGRGTAGLAAAMVIAVVAGFLLLRSNAAQSATATQPPAVTNAAGLAGDSPAAPTDTVSTPAGSTDAATAAPGSAAPTPGSTPAQPKSTPGTGGKTPRPDPGPSDAPHPTWSPPTVFSATLWFERECFNGTSYDMLYIDWSSPTPVDDIHLWLNDTFRGVTWFASGGGPQYESRAGASQDLVVGTTYVASATFFDVDNNVIAGPIAGTPYTPATPTGAC